MTTRRAVSRSIITTRSSSSKPTKHKSERHDHQEVPTTTATQQESSSNITTITDQNNQPCSPSPTEKVINSSNAEDEEGCGCKCNWSTPKAKRFRIPDIESCPPAPKKQRTSSTTNGSGSNCSNLRRSSISFFTPTDLGEVFFRVSGVSSKSTAA